MRSIYAGVTAPISGVVCAARSAVSTVVSPRRLFSTSLKLLSTYTRRSPTATTNPVTAGSINVVPVHASRQASQAATMADVVPKPRTPEPRPVTSAPTFMIDAIPNSDATEITFVVVSTTSSPMRCNPMVDGHDTTAPIHFTVPAGWALDHDANQFQDLTFQRVDPLPHNGERRVTSVEIDEDAHVVIVKLNARASTPSASQGSSSWSETAVECRVPFAAVLSSAIASAASRFADRKSSVVSLYPELCAALSAELPPVSINSKAYSPVHIDTVRRMVAGSPIMNGGRGRPQWTVPPAVVASAMALADPRYWLAPRASEVLAAATTRGYTLDGGDMVMEKDRREMAAKRVKILRSVARHGFAVVEHDLGVVRGVLKSDLDALTKNGTSDVPIGSTYRCEPFRTEDPEERLRRRVTGIATMIQSTFGVVRNTHYGGTSTWGDSKIVEASAEKRHTNGHHHGAQTPTHLDTAYVQTGIGLHTDNTYFAEAPKMQVFGCLHRCPVLSRGGENYVADGFAVAAKLREEDPQLFELLTQVPVVAVYCKEGRGFSGCRPVLTVDDDMDVTQVSYNPYDRAPMVGGVLSSPLLDKFYTAYARFGTLAEQNSTCFQLHVGDVLFFDNYRMLHARKAFSGPRIMGGAYIGADDTASAMVDAALRGL